MGGANHYGQITLTFYATAGDNIRAVVWWKASNYNANLMATWTRMIFTKN